MQDGKYCTMCVMRAVQLHSFNKPAQAYYPSLLTNNLKSQSTSSLPLVLSVSRLDFDPVVASRAFTEIGKPLRTGRQEDSHEFLRFLVDGLQNSELSMHSSKPDKINAELKYTTSIHQLFGGRLRSRVTCQKCQHPSDTFDAFLDLSVEVRQCRSVREAFTKFIKMDRLEGQNKYKCDKCKILVNATKQLTIDEAPKALVVHLKRFSPTGGKIRDQVAYDQTFDISPYMSKGQHGARYSLYAVLCHHGGGPHSGHYTARVRSTDGKRWGSMDDSEVNVSSKAPLGLQDAYILFYIREKGDALSRAIHTAAPAPKQPLNPFEPVATDSGDVVERRYEQQQQRAREQEPEQPEAGPSRLGGLPYVNGGGAVAGAKRTRDEIKNAPEDASSASDSDEEEEEDDDAAPSSAPRAQSSPPKAQALPFPLAPSLNSIQRASSSTPSSSSSKPKHQPPPGSFKAAASPSSNGWKANVPLPPPTASGTGKKKHRRDKKKNRTIDPYGVSRAGAGGAVSKFDATIARGKSLVAGMKGRNE